jgi:hypothetical protein
MKTKRKNSFVKTVYTTAAIAGIIILAFSLSSCITIKISDVKGSGQIETEEFEVADFNSLEFMGLGNIIITQGDKESLTVEAENNVIENLEVSTQGNTLSIGFKNRFINIIPTKPINYYLTVKDLREIKISGAGNVKCEQLTTRDMRILSSGLGNMEMQLAAEELQVDISGAGKIVISGEVKTQFITISGAGAYEAFNLESSDCKISISGVGKAELNASDTLDIRMSGLGSIEYKGNPEVAQNISGGGKIKSVD